jgi:hypothetical protein
MRGSCTPFNFSLRRHAGWKRVHLPLTAIHMTQCPNQCLIDIQRTPHVKQVEKLQWVDCSSRERRGTQWSSSSSNSSCLHFGGAREAKAVHSGSLSTDCPHFFSRTAVMVKGPPQLPAQLMEELGLGSCEQFPYSVTELWIKLVKHLREADTAAANSRGRMLANRIDMTKNLVTLSTMGVQDPPNRCLLCLARDRQCRSIRTLLRVKK